MGAGEVFVELDGEHLAARVAVLAAGAAIDLLNDGAQLGRDADLAGQFDSQAEVRGAPERPLNIGASRCSPGS